MLQMYYVEWYSSIQSQILQLRACCFKLAEQSDIQRKLDTIQVLLLLIAYSDIKTTTLLYFASLAGKKEKNKRALQS